MIFSGAGGLVSFAQCYYMLNCRGYFRFVSSAVAGVCCRKVLLEYFDEGMKPSTLKPAAMCATQLSQSV